MEAKVASLLRTLGSCEIEIERVRHEIVDVAGTQLDKAFYMVERTGDGYITPAHLLEFLKDNEIEAEEDEAETIIDQYDLAETGSLCHDDFIRAIKPQDRNQNKFHQRITNKEQGIKHALIKFFVKELELARKVLQHKSEIVSRKWTSFDSYRCFDTKGNGSFTYEDFDIFLQKHGVVLPHIDIRAAFRRVDKNGNGSVTYKELSETLFNETHLEHISQNCCSGKIKRGKPTKPAKQEASPEPKESVKQEKEASSPEPERNSLATTQQTNFKSQAESTFKSSFTPTNLWSSRYTYTPRIYDVQTYVTPSSSSMKIPPRPLAAEYYAYQSPEYRFPRPLDYKQVVVTPPPVVLTPPPAIHYQPFQYVQPVQQVQPLRVTEYRAPDVYSSRTTLERPVTTWSAPRYRPVSLNNVAYSSHVNTYLPSRDYTPNRLQFSSYPATRNQSKSIIMPRNQTLYRSTIGSTVIDEAGSGETIVTEAPFGRLTTRVNSSPGPRRIEVERARTPQPMRVSTVTRVYNPVEVGIRHEPVVRRFY